jgi:DNA/RNA-binding domain of Phe-tRNA-synthetase-like protein
MVLCRWSWYPESMRHSVKCRLDPALQADVLLGLVSAEPVGIAPAGQELESEIAAVCKQLRAEHAGKKPSEIPGTAPARTLYRVFGIDPTHTRPSSEALLRRVIAGKPFPCISNAVDLCNFVALKWLLSLGLYDRDKIEGPVVLRRGRPGESFAGIRKDEVHVEGRIVLADDRGPFGNPSSDSLRTAVGETTRSLWMVIFAPSNYPRERMQQHVEEARSMIGRHLAPSGELPRSLGELLPV